eukprot:Em0005g883a
MSIIRDCSSLPNMHTWTTTVAVLFVCSLVHSGYAAVILAPYQEANCTQIEAHGNNLQEVLINVSLTEPSDACFQVAIAPGNYTISQVLNISQNISLQGVGDVVGISFNVTKPVDSQASQPFYVMQFLNASFAAFTNIHFTSSPGIIGFVNVTEVRITNCTFSYFIQGAVDMYGCGYPTITNSTFQHNGPAAVIKPQPYRVVPPANGEIGDYGYFRNCSFQNNSATDFGAAIAVSSALVLSNREMFTPTDIINCTFAGNKISNSGGGVIGAAYIQVILNGTNKFSRNSGASILLVGSVMRVGGSLQMINNTNEGQGGTLYVLSHGRIILYDNVQVTFDGNNGSSGASIVTEGAIPSIFEQLPDNRLCFLQHSTSASLSSQIAQHNIYRGGIWGVEGSSLNEYGDNLVTYACPMEYCQCCVEDQGAIAACLFSVNSMDLNSQCVNNRKGILCGNCIEGLGVGISQLPYYTPN